MGIPSKLIEFLNQNKVRYEILHHPEAFTAQELAAIEHVKGKQHAKVVMVQSDGAPVMTVLPADHRVDLDKFNKLTGKAATLATEADFKALFPLFRERRIGCWNWGLVAGRTQTYFPWGSPKNAPEPNPWQHDILRADGTPFNAREVQFIKGIMGKLPARKRSPIRALGQQKKRNRPQLFSLLRWAISDGLKANFKGPDSNLRFLCKILNRQHRRFVQSPLWI